MKKVLYQSKQVIVGIILFSIISVGTLKVQAQIISTVLTPDDSVFVIKAEVRNGNSNYVGALWTPTTSPAPDELDGNEWRLSPSDSRIWDLKNDNYNNSYGDFFKFKFRFTPGVGKTEWFIDFNRDGDFDDYQESVVNIDTDLINKNFRFINVWGQGKTKSSSRFSISITDLKVNGLTFGNFSSNSNTVFTKMFQYSADTLQLFENITVSGQFSFSGSGDDDHPTLCVRLANPSDQKYLIQDLNRDNQVSMNDFLLLISKFGLPCESCSSDLDNNGTVEINDFLSLISKYGYGTDTVTKKTLLKSISESSLDDSSKLKLMEVLNGDSVSVESYVSMSNIQKSDKNIDGLLVYPNPAINIISAEFQATNSSKTTIQLLDCLGQVVFEQDYQIQPGLNNVSFEINAIPKGVYLFNIQTKSNVLSKIIIKE